MTFISKPDDASIPRRDPLPLQPGSRPTPEIRKLLCKTKIIPTASTQGQRDHITDMSKTNLRKTDSPPKKIQKAIRLSLHQLSPEAQKEVLNRQTELLRTLDKQFQNIHPIRPMHSGKARSPSIPKNLFSDPLSGYEVSDKEKITGHVATSHKDSLKPYEHLDPLQTGVGEMQANAFKREGDQIKLVPGQVFPTLDSRGHLTNAYSLVVHGKNYGVIRTGVINTQQKADEFVALLKEMWAKIQQEPQNFGKVIKLRVVSQQLNSFEIEADLINDQHCWLAYANEKLTKIGEIIHINTPSNRWYDIVKHGFGSFFSKLVNWVRCGQFKNGETLSRELNRDSWSMYTKWLAEDLRPKIDDLRKISQSKLNEEETFLGSLESQNEKIQALKTNIELSPFQIKSGIDEFVENFQAMLLIKKNIQDLLELINKKQIEFGSINSKDPTKLKEQEQLFQRIQIAKKSLSEERAEMGRLLKSAEKTLNFKIPMIQSYIQFERDSLKLAPTSEYHRARLDGMLEIYHAMDTLLEDLKPQIQMFAHLERKVEFFEKLETNLAQFTSQHSKVKQCSKFIQMTLRHIAEAKGIIAENDVSPGDLEKAQTTIKDQEARLKYARKRMKGHLKNDFKILQSLKLGLETCLSSKKYLIISEKEMDETFTPMLQKISLMHQILGSQLGRKNMKLDRGQEGMAIQSLNSLLGITSALNCMSGLDRTGLWHAIKLAVETLLQTLGTNAVFNLVNEWEATTVIINKIITRCQPDHVYFYEWLKNEKSLCDQILDLESEMAIIQGTPIEFELLKKKLNVLKIIEREVEDKENLLKPKMIDITEFRKVVLAKLIHLGIPITITSTGLAGFKYNPGEWLKENLIPLNFLPPFVEVNRYFVRIISQRGESQEVEIVKFKSTLIGKEVEFSSDEVTQSLDPKTGKIRFFVNDGENEVEVEGVYPTNSIPIGNIESHPEQIALVKYDQHGKVEAFTKAGADLLCRVAGMRLEDRPDFRHTQ